MKKSTLSQSLFTTALLFLGTGIFTHSFSNPPPVESLLDDAGGRDRTDIKPRILIFPSFIDAKEIMLRSANTDADMKSEEFLRVQNGADEASKSAALVSFNLEGLTQKSTASAQLYVQGMNVGEGISSCIYAHSEGRLAGSCILNARPEKTGGAMVVTDAVNRALAAGKKEIAFTLTHRGIAGTQKGFDMNRVVWLGVQKEQTAPFSLAEYLRPVWKAGRMTNESVFLIEPEEGGGARANLAFIPKESIVVQDGLLNEFYKLGTDYEIKGRTIIALPNSKMKTFKYDYVFKKEVPEGDPMRHFKFPKLGRFAISPEGGWFHENQIFVTYEHDGAGWNARKFAEKFDRTLLPKTIALLASDNPIKIMLFGDSISEGANASGRAAKRPYMPSYGELVATALRSGYRKDNLEYINPSLGGATASWGDLHAESLVANERPDLVIIAFGMNGSDTPEEHAGKVKSIMSKVSDKNPNAEFILVALMQPNSEWRRLQPHDGYAAALKELRRPGVFVADIWEIHAELLKNKKYSDMTGNHVNHPNDFLIRCYAQAVLEPLIPLD